MTPEKSEKAMQALKRRYKALLDGFIEGVCLCNRDGRILIANQAFANLTETVISHVIGKSITELFDRKTQEAIEKSMLQISRMSSIAGIEAKCLRSDNGVFPLSMNFSLFKANGMGNALLLISLRDLRRENQIAEELCRSQSESEELLAELDEAYRELKDMQEEAVRRERLAASAEIATGVVHEIRNPLTIIGMSIQYLHSKLSPQHPHREFTSVIMKKVEQIDKITTRLLSYGRPFVPKMEVGNVHRNLNQVLQLAKARCLAQRVGIVKHFNRRFPNLEYDPDLLDEVLTNLVTNALDAMPTGGTLEVETQVDPKCKEAWVKISDTGIGIPCKARDQIFRPFFTRKRGGAGLGLAISKRIIEQHHGELTFFSKSRGSNRGTTFTIKLPIISRG